MDFFLKIFDFLHVCFEHNHFFGVAAPPLIRPTVGTFGAENDYVQTGNDYLHFTNDCVQLRND